MYNRAQDAIFPNYSRIKNWLLPTIPVADRLGHRHRNVNKKLATANNTCYSRATSLECHNLFINQSARSVENSQATLPARWIELFRSLFQSQNRQNDAENYRLYADLITPSNSSFCRTSRRDSRRA